MEEQSDYRAHLLSQFGDPAALPVLCDSREADRLWKRLLRSAGRIPSIAAALPAARLACESYARATEDRDHTQCIQRLLHAIGEWVAFPSGQNLQQVEQTKPDWASAADGRCEPARAAVTAVRHLVDAMECTERFDKAIVSAFRAAAAAGVPTGEMDRLVREALRRHLCAQ